MRIVKLALVQTTEDFQARRATFALKPKDGGKPRFVHTLMVRGLLWVVLDCDSRELPKKDGTIEVQNLCSPIW